MHPLPPLRQAVGHMPKKTIKKKRAFQAFCRKQVVEQGLINHADGSWRKAEMGKSQDASMIAGYKAR